MSAEHTAETSYTDSQADTDWVSILNRHCQQKCKPQPNYTFEHHGTSFAATCEFNGESYETGMWFSTKTMAKQMAAKEAVVSIRTAGARQ